MISTKEIAMEWEKGQYNLNLKCANLTFMSQFDFIGAILQLNEIKFNGLKLCTSFQMKYYNTERHMK